MSDLTPEERAALRDYVQTHCLAGWFSQRHFGEMVLRLLDSADRHAAEAATHAHAIDAMDRCHAAAMEEADALRARVAELEGEVAELRTDADIAKHGGL